MIRKRLVFIAGYYYLSNPIYFALKEYLPTFEVSYFFPKDIIGADINCSSFDREAFSRDVNLYKELDYDPPWFTASASRWFERSIVQKITNVLRILRGTKKYVRHIVSAIIAARPDVIVVTSDIFFVPRIVNKYFPDLPLVIIQPCFLDLRAKPHRLGFVKRLLNRLVNEPVFEKQQYFGLECLESMLLVWGDASHEFYSRRRGNVYKIDNPAHYALIEKVLQLKRFEKKNLLSQFSLDPQKHTIVIFSGHFESLYGNAFQRSLEVVYREMFDKLSSSFNIILKVHPNDELGYWRDKVGQFESDMVKVVRDIDKHELMALCDVAISTYSYAGFEAALTGSILVNLYPGTQRDNNDHEWMSKYFAINADSSASITRFLVNLLSAHDYELYAEKAREKVNEYNENRSVGADLSILLNSFIKT